MIIVKLAVQKKSIFFIFLAMPPMHTLTVQLHRPLSDGFHNLEYMLPRYALPACNIHGKGRLLDIGVLPNLSQSELDVMQNCPFCETFDRMCKCNATHRVFYTAKKSVDADIVVYDTHGVRLPIVEQRHKKNLLLLVEPPAHLSFTSVSNFDGLMSYHSDAAVHRPFNTLNSILWAASRLKPDFQRSSIGMWVNNCDSQLRNEVWRNISRAKLPFESHGKCGNTVPDSVSKNLHIVSMNAKAQQLCRKHRMMISVENFACSSWFSEHLHTAFVCGAIPIVRTRNGQPDYVSTFGNIPVVDAAQPGWMDIVQKIMYNDSFYKEFLSAFATLKVVFKPNPRQFHCQLFGVKKRMPSNTLHWPQCQ